MERQEYDELKARAEARLLPLRNHDKGRYANIDTCVWGDGDNLGQECGFRALAKMGWIYRKTIQVHFWDDYEAKRKELEAHITQAEAAALEAEPAYGIGWELTHWRKGIECDGFTISLDEPERNPCNEYNLRYL